RPHPPQRFGRPRRAAAARRPQGPAIFLLAQIQVVGIDAPQQRALAQLSVVTIRIQQVTPRGRLTRDAGGDDPAVPPSQRVEPPDGGARRAGVALADLPVWCVLPEPVPLPRSRLAPFRGPP